MPATLGRQIRCAPTLSLVLTIFEAAHILGLSPEQARRVLDERQPDVDELEQLAMEHYPWHTHARNDDSYWCTSRQAAKVLGLSYQRVKQLLDDDRLPYLVHRSGARLLRRHQVEVIANAREARFLR